MYIPWSSNIFFCISLKTWVYVWVLQALNLYQILSLHQCHLNIQYSHYQRFIQSHVHVSVQVNSALECSFLLLKGPYDDVRIKPVIHHHSFSNDTNETDYVPLPISDSVECNKLLAAKNINLRLFIFQVQK